MNQISSLAMASQSFWLWPPIADAVETMLRRRDDADDYERVWRSIHIWESVTTTLSCSAAAYIVSNGTDVECRKHRELLYGVSWDEIGQTLKPSGLGALGGSNEKRIQMLGVVMNSTSDGSLFLNQLRQFLDATGEPDGDGDGETVHGFQPTFNSELRRFAQAWGRVCDVQRDLERAKPDKRFRVIDALGFINTFRNRFAHVPFPYDPLEPIRKPAESRASVVGLRLKNT